MSFLEACRRNLVTGIEGPTLTDRERSELKACPPAGILLFERNILSSIQTRGLVDELVVLLEDEDGPPMIMVDHEGGPVAHAHRAIGIPPAAAAFGAVAGAGCGPEGERDLEAASSLVRGASFETARRLREVGIDFSLAPVLDLALDPDNSVIGTRSFGTDALIVSELGCSVLEGFREAGVRSCAKHFPGHGATSIDSHLDLPRLSVDIETLARRELVPFERAIRAGVDSVLLGHLILPGEEIPASLSEASIRGLLRRDMGFEGVVMTDAIEMGALRSYGEPLEIAARAFAAGNDLILTGRPWGEIADGLDRDRNTSEVPGSDSRSRIRSLRAARPMAAGREEIDRPTPYEGAARRSLHLARSATGCFERRIEPDCDAWIVADTAGLPAGGNIRAELEGVLDPISLEGVVVPIIFDGSEPESAARARAAIEADLIAPAGDESREGGRRILLLVASRGPVRFLPLLVEGLQDLPVAVVGFGCPDLGWRAPKGWDVLQAWDLGQEARSAIGDVLAGRSRASGLPAFDFGGAG